MVTAVAKWFAHQICAAKQACYIFPRENGLIYIDDAEVSKYGRCWFHLTADSLEELHAFAARIGLPSHAFHLGARHPHYDVTESQRLRALSSGARAVSPRDLVRIARQVSALAHGAVAPTSGPQLALFS